MRGLRAYRGGGPPPPRRGDRRRGKQEKFLNFRLFLIKRCDIVDLSKCLDILRSGHRRIHSRRSFGGEEGEGLESQAGGSDRGRGH